jgi:hypothetical protein
VNRSAVLEDEPAFLGGSARGGAFLLDIPFEAVKELLPHIRSGDEDIATVRLVAHAAEIAERTKSVQGASDYRLRHAKNIRQTANGVGPGVM